MATSSMHKPGWRSRRRSRLSLVERAVPRLGYHPEPDDKGHEKPANGTSTRAKDDAKPDMMASVLDAGPDCNADPSSDMPASAEADQARTKVLANDESADRQQATDVPAAASPASITRDPLTAKPTTPLIGDDGFERPEMALATPPAGTSNVTADETAHREDQAPAAPEDDRALRLDWDGLTENGFVDPRNRDQALSSSMDDIVRVLIRQALSDQAGWRDRVILVTSPTERASKSTAAINFALGLTTVGDHRAVLVDVDTAGLGAVDRLGVADRTGITEALVDSAIDIGDLVVKTDLERLTLVPSGPPDEDMLDRFASHRMLSILRFLTEDPNTILIIDAPPILVSKEAAVLSVVAGQVVMAVEAGITKADQIDHALQRIGERHNVSLVLVETSGIVRDDTEAVAFVGEPAPVDTSSRLPPLARRRPSKMAAAAAAGAVAVSLFLAQLTNHQPAPDRYALPDRHLAVSPPERWSGDGMAAETSSRQMGQ